jgi:hypothetical protein
MKYEIPCQHCGFDGMHKATQLPTGQHWGRIDCGGCGKWIKWLPKPESDPTKYRRPTSHKNLVEKFGRGFCEMCLRAQGELGARETLDGHHVLEFQNGGEPSRENVWILCTACHRLVNWTRTYHGRNAPEAAEASDA